MIAAATYDNRRKWGIAWTWRGRRHAVRCGSVPPLIQLLLEHYAVAKGKK